MGAGVFGEQIAVERLQPDGARLVVFAKQREGLAQPVPQVGRAVGGEVALGAAAQVGDGVVVGVYAVELGAAFGELQQHAALFRRHQKQQPIHQPQKLAIVAFGGQRRLPGDDGRKGVSQRSAVGMLEKSPAQGKQRAPRRREACRVRGGGSQSRPGSSAPAGTGRAALRRRAGASGAAIGIAARIRRTGCLQ